jgi:hypothetical protein
MAASMPTRKPTAHLYSTIDIRRQFGPTISAPFTENFSLSARLNCSDGDMNGSRSTSVTIACFSTDLFYACCRYLDSQRSSYHSE